MSVELFNGQPWAPGTYTRPLRPGPMLSDGPRLVRLMERHWRDPKAEPLTGPILDGPPAGGIRLDCWQASLFTHVLERYPLDWHVPELRGKLRFRQVLISLARQNGKSLIGAGLGLYGLLQHVRGPNVLGVATSREKANIVYDRVRFAVDNDDDLKARLKATGTRGITRRDGTGRYLIQPTLAEGVQGEPTSLGVVDEVHLTPAIMWDSLVKGQTSMAEALLAGITTAGDEDSRLLKRLYRRGHAAAQAPENDERFGIFLWEGPEDPSLDNDAHIMAANPRVAEGRLSIDIIRSDARDQPREDLERYTFNRFVKRAAGAWADMAKWRAGYDQGWPEGRPVTFGIGRAAGWQTATITATAVDDQGHTWTQVVASLVRPSSTWLIALVEDLLTRHPTSVAAMESATLSAQGKYLRDRGFDVWILTPTELSQAASHLYALINRGHIHHPGDELLTRQLPASKRITSPRTGSWTIGPGTSDFDSVAATIAGVWVAETRPEPDIQIF